MKLHMQILIALGLGLKRNGHIFFGLIAGIIVGIVLYSHNVELLQQSNPIFAVIMNILTVIGQSFIRLIQMVIIPLVFSAIVIGISSIGDNKQLGNLGKKMVFYYAIITVLAVIIGAVLALTVKPGVGVQAYINHQSALESQQIVHDALVEQNFTDIAIRLIPKNPLESLATGDMIPIIIFVMIFAIALAKVGEVSRPVISFFESIFAATMKVTDWIMYLAAPGVFALTAVAIASFGSSIFGVITKFFLVLMVGFVIQLFIVYPLMMRIFSKVPVLIFYAAIAEAMMVAFGTASSSATLPLTIACCERRGISHKICSFVLPLGATLNMDATALFQTVAVIFLTQAYGIVLEPIQIFQVMLLAIVASSTCAGIPGGGIITIAVVLNGLGLSPDQLIQGFAFLFAIDRIVDMVRTMNNVTSDAVVAAIIADNENEINYDLLSNPESYKDII